MDTRQWFSITRHPAAPLTMQWLFPHWEAGGWFLSLATIFIACGVLHLACACVCEWARFYKDPLLGMLIGGKFRPRSAGSERRRTSTAGTGHSVDFEEQVTAVLPCPPCSHPSVVQRQVTFAQKRPMAFHET